MIDPAPPSFFAAPATAGAFAMSTPSCPHCGGNTQRYGTTTAGSPRCRCKVCKRTFSPAPAKRGRPMLGDAPLSSAEKAKRQRAKRKKAQ